MALQEKQKIDLAAIIRAGSFATLPDEERAAVRRFVVDAVPSKEQCPKCLQARASFKEYPVQNALSQTGLCCAHTIYALIGRFPDYKP